MQPQNSPSQGRTFTIVLWTAAGVGMAASFGCVLLGGNQLIMSADAHPDTGWLRASLGIGALLLAVITILPGVVALKRPEWLSDAQRRRMLLTGSPRRFGVALIWSGSWSLAATLMFAFDPLGGITLIPGFVLLCVIAFGPMVALMIETQCRRRPERHFLVADSAVPPPNE